jgi:hypothetical protein
MDSNAIATVPGIDIGQTGVTLMEFFPVHQASKYQICVRDFNAPNCYFDEARSASSGVLTNSGRIQFQIPIPQNREGTVSQWSAAACYANDICGSHSPRARFFIVPNAPTLLAPADNTVLRKGRTVTFSWSNNPLATAGYQLLVFTVLALEEIGFNKFNPTAVPPPNRSIAILPAGNTNHTITLAPNQNRVYWTVLSCAASERGRRCSTQFPPRRTLSVFTGLQLPGINP